MSLTAKIAIRNEDGGFSLRSFRVSKRVGPFVIHRPICGWLDPPAMSKNTGFVITHEPTGSSVGTWYKFGSIAAAAKAARALMRLGDWSFTTVADPRVRKLGKRVLKILREATDKEDNG